MIKCLTCGKYVNARLTTGAEVYPHLNTLHHKKFYKCDICGNYVGCHPNTTKPLGVIPNREIRLIRRHIHSVLDPIWKSGLMKRGEVYMELSKRLGYTYHTANIESVEQGRLVLNEINNLKIECEFINGI